MKTRRMAKLAVMAAALLASLPARAATTNEVDIAALIAAVEAGQSETNGWTLSGLDFVSDDGILKFPKKDTSAESPDFGASILRIEALVRCSSVEPTRLLYVTDEAGEIITNFAKCAEANTLEHQALDIGSLGMRMSRFKLLMTGSNNTGVWGLKKLKVVFDFDAPTCLEVSRNGGDWCGLSWANGEYTVSNRVETFSIERGEGDEVIFRTDFTGFDGGTSTTSNYTDKVSEMLTNAFSGVRVYGAAGMSGVCQLGTGKELGILRYDGIDDYSNVVLKLRARQYSNSEGDETTIAWESEDGAEGTMTNDVKTIKLAGDFADYEIDLSCITNAGAALLLGYYKTKTTRRVLIDSMSIVRTHPDTLTPIDCRWIPATQGAASFSTRDYGIELLPKSEYRFEVRAKTAGVLVSDPSAVDVVLDSLPGFRFILR